ncbi:MAG: O-antigen ligase family protein [Deltaproteobacteria bacterium]
MGWRRWVSSLFTLVLGLGVTFAVTVPGTPSAAWWVVVVASLALWQRPQTDWVGVERLWLIALLLVPLAAIVSLLNASDVADSAGRIEKFFRFALAVPVYLAWRSQAEERAVWIFLFVTAGALLLGPVAVVQVFAAGLERAAGVVHPIMFGDTAMVLAVLVLVSLTAIGMSTATSRGLRRLCGGLAIASALVACLLSQTRNAILVVPVLVVALPFLLRRQIRLRRWLPVWLGLGVLGLILDLSFPAIAHHILLAVEEALAWWRGAEGAMGTSVGGRLYVWELCLALWQQHPLVGNGIGDYLPDLRVLTQASGDTDLVENTSLNYHAHSIYLHGLLTQGVLGTMVLLVVLVLPLRQAMLLLRTASDSRDTQAALACLSPALCFLVFGIGEAWVVKNSFVSIYLLLQVPFMALASERLRAVRAAEACLDLPASPR